jgi:hypothetical protein
MVSFFVIMSLLMYNFGNFFLVSVSFSFFSNLIKADNQLDNLSAFWGFSMHTMYHEISRRQSPNRNETGIFCVGCTDFTEVLSTSSETYILVSKV